MKGHSAYAAVGGLRSLALLLVLGWGVAAEANLAQLRIQDRTPGRAADTNFSYSPACCNPNDYSASVA